MSLCLNCQSKAKDFSLKTATPFPKGKVCSRCGYQDDGVELPSYDEMRIWVAYQMRREEK